MVTCPECKSEMLVTRKDYTYRGLPSVTLVDLEHRTCAACGEEEIVIPALAQLNALIAECLVRKPEPLTPSEFRFLRKSLGWSGSDTARRLGVKAETVSRWENGSRSISPTADRAVRLCVVHEAPIQDYATADELERVQPKPEAEVRDLPVRMRRNSKRWKPEDAACA